MWYFVLAHRRQIIKSITYTDYSSSIGQCPAIDPHRLSNIANSPNHSSTCSGDPLGCEVADASLCRNHLTCTKGARRPYLRPVGRVMAHLQRQSVDERIGASAKKKHPLIADESDVNT